MDLNFEKNGELVQFIDVFLLLFFNRCVLQVFVVYVVAVPQGNVLHATKGVNVTHNHHQVMNEISSSLSEISQRFCSVTFHLLPAS